MDRPRTQQKFLDKMVSHHFGKREKFNIATIFSRIFPTACFNPLFYLLSYLVRSERKKIERDFFLPFPEFLFFHFCRSRAGKIYFCPKGMGLLNSFLSAVFAKVQNFLLSTIFWLYILGEKNLLDSWGDISQTRSGVTFSLSFSRRQSLH